MQLSSVYSDSFKHQGCKYIRLFSLGIFWPAMGVLRGKYVPESSKCSCIVDTEMRQWFTVDKKTILNLLSFLLFSFSTCHDHEYLSCSSESNCYSSFSSGL